jgi:flagellar protein FlaG
MVEEGVNFLISHRNKIEFESNEKDVDALIQPSRPVNETMRPVPQVDAPSAVNKIARKPEERDLHDFEAFGQRAFTSEEVKTAVEKLNDVLAENSPRTHSRFRIHEGTGRVMVNLVDTRTDEIIKELPPEKILDLVANIWEMVGIIVDERG